MPKKSKVVPLHLSTVPETQLGDHEARSIFLPGDRQITVAWEPDGQRAVQIRRPAPDGNTAELVFGLSEEAAYALRQLLNESFELCPTTETLREVIRAQRTAAGEPEEPR